MYKDIRYIYECIYIPCNSCQKLGHPEFQQSSQKIHSNQDTKNSKVLNIETSQLLEEGQSKELHLHFPPRDAGGGRDCCHTHSKAC